MSVPSSKTSVTDEIPNREVLRICANCGRPPIATSTRLVTYCSISSGERPAASVSTMTCVLVMSGTASMGMYSALMTPPIASKQNRAITRKRLLSEVLISSESMRRLFFPFEQQFRFQIKRPAINDRVARFQPGRNLDSVVGFEAQLNVNPAEFALAVRDKDERLILMPHDRAGRHDEAVTSL